MRSDTLRVSKAKRLAEIASPGISDDDRALFELLTLEGAQAGLSWITVLRKRDAYREAFAGLPGISLLALDKPETLNCQYVVGQLSPDLPAGARDVLVDVLWAENVVA